MTSKQAYTVASQWGSYMRDGDPGAVFYSFIGDSAIVQNEAHRQALIAYTKDCLSKADDEQKEELAELLQYVQTAPVVSDMELDSFTEAYIEAALWSSTDDDGEPLDANYTLADIAPKTLAKMIADCAKFKADNAQWITNKHHVRGNSCSVEEYAGHDFWLTRCGHDGGFWDGDWSKDSGNTLTKASKAFGNVDLYVGDDGLIYS